MSLVVMFGFEAKMSFYKQVSETCKASSTFMLRFFNSSGIQCTYGGGEFGQIEIVYSRPSYIKSLFHHSYQ